MCNAGFDASLTWSACDLIGFKGILIAVSIAPIRNQQNCSKAMQQNCMYAEIAMQQNLIAPGIIEAIYINETVHTASNATE